jgi:hypothetical protein
MGTGFETDLWIVDVSDLVIAGRFTGDQATSELYRELQRYVRAIRLS